MRPPRARERTRGEAHAERDDSHDAFHRRGLHVSLPLLLFGSAHRAAARMGTSEGTLVELLVGAISLGGLLGREGLRLGRLLVAVVLVVHLRGPIARADRQIGALVAPVTVRE